MLGGKTSRRNASRLAVLLPQLFALLIQAPQLLTSSDSWPKGPKLPARMVWLRAVQGWKQLLHFKKQKLGPFDSICESRGLDPSAGLPLSLKAERVQRTEL